VKGIEPSFSAWEADVLPLNYTRKMLGSISVLAQSFSIYENPITTVKEYLLLRGNAAEVLRAMQGHGERSWRDYEHRRYSAGHAFLKDGEQCGIPSRIAERASRIGLYVKTLIAWLK
jgi:hypothetical protein